MKFSLKLILILAAAYLLQPHFSWWIILIISFISSVLVKTNWFSSFVSAFLAIGGLWFYMAYSIDYETSSILTKKVASIFTLGDPVYLIIITALIGGTAAGFASLTGHTFMKLFEKKKSRYY